MNKGELIKAMAEKAGFTGKDAAAAYEAFVEVVTETLKAGEKVQLVGFGTFEVKARAARAGMNPITKEAITIPASKYPAFSAGSALKASVNK